jgi:hypothetical protein
MFRASDRQPPNGALIYNIKPGDVVESSPLQRAIVDMAAAAGGIPSQFSSSKIQVNSRVTLW